MRAVETFQTTHGAARLYTCLWRAVTHAPARALVVVSHGLGEHAGRYREFADFFTAAGFHVAAWDHEGHGQSSGAPGVITSGSSLVAEVESVTRAVLARLRPAPADCILWGHSMGGLLTLEALRQPKLAKLFRAGVVTAAPLGLGSEPNALLRLLAGPVASAVPRLTQSNGLERAHLSRDPGVVAAYAADPLVHDRVSMRLGELLLRLPRAMLAGPSAFPIPILLMHGERDEIARLDTAAKFAELNRGTGVEFQPWPGLFHEIHNEPERLEVLAFAKTWIERQLSRT